jgi:hypothetical protein
MSLPVEFTTRRVHNMPPFKLGAVAHQVTIDFIIYQLTGRRAVAMLLYPFPVHIYQRYITIQNFNDLHSVTLVVFTHSHWY